MKLSEKARNLLRTDKNLRLRVAMALGFTEFWITALIKKNAHNGPLTTAAALEVFRIHSGLKTDDELLVKETIDPVPVATL